MNEYNINVDFIKGRISTNLRKLVQNDYNTTKLNFTFDKEGRVLFKMLYPDGTQYVDEIQNNELVFGKGVLNQEGTYEYEISLYSEDGRLTDYAVKSFEVRGELVNTDELVEPDDRIPILDKLINEVDAIKQDVAEGKYDGKDYEITEKDYQEIETNVKEDIQPILENIENVSKQAEVIARGRATGYVFETVADLDEWLLDEENISKLTLGDNFYIVATNVPDYWWDGTQKRVLETEKPDLTEYAKKEQFVTLTNEDEYEKLATNGTYTREDGTTLIFSANTYYFIPEEE